MASEKLTESFNFYFYHHFGLQINNNQPIFYSLIFVFFFDEKQIPRHTRSNQKKKYFKLVIIKNERYFIDNNDVCGEVNDFV